MCLQDETHKHWPPTRENHPSGTRQTHAKTTLLSRDAQGSHSLGARTGAKGPAQVRQEINLWGASKTQLQSVAAFDFCLVSACTSAWLFLCPGGVIVPSFLFVCLPSGRCIDLGCLHRGIMYMMYELCVLLLLLVLVSVHTHTHAHIHTYIHLSLFISAHVFPSSL